MGFLDWLFGKKISKKQNEIPTTKKVGLTAIGNTEPVCPYCNYRFDKMPLKKKQCPKCNNFVRSRSRPFDNKKVLIKENQIEELDRQWAIKNERSDGIKLGASPEVRQQLSQKLAHQIETNTNCFKGISTESTNQIRNIIAEGVRTEKSIKEISREIVRQVEGIDIECAITIIKTETMKAVNVAAVDRYKQAGIKRLEFLAAADESVCETCSNLDGQIFDIDNLPEVPVHPGCRCCLTVTEKSLGIADDEEVLEKHPVHGK